MFYNEDNLVEVDEDDACFTCRYRLTGIACPLLEALAVGVALLPDPVTINPSCGFYVPFERHLKLL